MPSHPPLAMRVPTGASGAVRAPDRRDTAGFHRRRATRAGEVELLFTTPLGHRAQLLSFLIADLIGRPMEQVGVERRQWLTNAKDTAVTSRPSSTHPHSCCRCRPSGRGVAPSNSGSTQAVPGKIGENIIAPQ